MNSTFRSCVAELLGTFTLTFIGAGAIIANVPNGAGGGGGIVAIALAHGIALAMAVYATGHISGGHINPAVTVAMLATGRIAAPKALAYIVSQCAGSVLAAFVLISFFPGEPVNNAKLGATLGSEANQVALGPMGTLVLEAIFTLLLITTIFATAVDGRGPKNVYGFAIGLTIGMDILCGGALTGASMNPARSLGPALVGGFWKWHHVYWIGPILGAVVGAFLYDRLLLVKEERQA
jgi:MIP family channel proteins